MRRVCRDCGAPLIYLGGRGRPPEYCPLCRAVRKSVRNRAYYLAQRKKEKP